jgi:hypothetical protein
MCVWERVWMKICIWVCESVNANVCMSIIENMYVDKNMYKCMKKFISLDMRDKLKVKNLKVYHPMSSPNQWQMYLYVWMKMYVCDCV